MNVTNHFWVSKPALSGLFSVLCSTCSYSEQTVLKREKDRSHKASMRASETSEQTVHRREEHRNHKASMRASETSEQTVHRREEDRNHKASMRASKTSEQTVHRQQQTREHMASMRASETSEQTVHRREKDRSNKASTRATKKASNVSVQQAIMSFHADIKNGPDFVCSCCHRLMYSKSVVPCNPAKYTKCTNNLLECVFSADLRYVSDTGNE